MNLKNYPKYPTIPPNNQTISPRLNPAQGKKAGQPNRWNNVSFDDLLRQEVVKQQEVKLSAHAEKRLKERNISFSQEDFTKINRAVQQAAAKGSKDSLILYKDLALVTSITNRTVVTAMDGKSMEEHVFTNIDSAVILK